MKKIQMLSVSIGVMVSLLIASSNTVSASVYQEQSQRSSTSSRFSSKCDGDDCGSTKVTFKSKSKMKQSQSQSYGREHNGWNSSNNNNYGGRKKHWPSYGSATISWDHRGGTCHIRYSESNASSYKYSTSAACDEGEATIGGLQRGTTYRFQVRQNDGHWSAPVWLRAY